VVQQRDVVRFHPDELCSNCLSMRARWGLVDGPAEGPSFNLMPRPYPPGLAAEMCYASVTARLETVSTVVPNLGLGAKPLEIGCGMGMVVAFEKLSGQVTRPQLRPSISS
jgi:hypothetical protein